MVPGLLNVGELAEYWRIAKVDEIGRRVVANNGFDGILTMIGVLMGSWVAGVQDARVVISTGLATCVAMGISGAWGAYMAESAERKHAMQELELALLRNLDGSQQARASRFAVVVIALLDGLSPLITGITALIPFFFGPLWGDITYTYVAGLALALMALFALGAFLATVAKENIIRAGVRMILAGVICVAISLLISAKG
ncbi:MAG: VIT1/CCC1 transporter family protein [Chloroflexi bacterium]|nr:VIT1/CCC1 transporter family protein [Chloroflexota bacterium]